MRSGKIRGAPTSDNEGRRTAEHILSRQCTVPKNHPVRQWVENARRSLSEKGLPARAPHAHIYVLEAQVYDGPKGSIIAQPHAANVTVAIGGRYGLAQDARITVIDQSPPVKTPSPQERSTHKALREKQTDYSLALARGDMTVDQLSDYLGLTIYRNLRNIRGGLAFAREKIGRVKDKGPISKVVNVSSGVSLMDTAGNMVSDIRQLKADSKLWAAIERKLGKTIEQAVDADLWAILLPLAKQGLEKRKGLITAEIDGITREIHEGRKVGMLVVTSAGNRRIEAEHMKDPAAARGFLREVPGIIDVASLRLAPRNGKPFATSYSGRGDVGGIGSNVPTVYGGNWEGTSAASPMVVGVIGLMTEANPMASPADIERMLLTTTRKIDYNAQLAGRGAVDPVAAVKLAASKRPSNFHWGPGGKRLLAPTQ